MTIIVIKVSEDTYNVSLLEETVAINFTEETVAVTFAEETIAATQTLEQINVTPVEQPINVMVEGGGIADVVKYISQTLSEVYYTVAEFIEGITVIGVKFLGQSFVYLPHELPVERLVVVKDEAGSGSVTVRVY